MRSIARILVFLLAGAALSLAISAQSPSPTPPDDDVVKISTRLIQIDVTVTDRKGRIVRDLRPEEVEVYENGKKQEITNFSFISSVRETNGQPTSDTAGLPLPPGPLRPEQVRRTIALVVDDLSLSFTSAYQTRRALRKFVDEQMQPGDLVAIIRTGAGIGALQQFTSDKRMLYAAIERVKWNPLGSGGIGAFAPIEATTDTSLQTADEETETDDTATTGTGQSLDTFRQTIFATGTLGALRYIVTGMGELPGRKSVILFSDGFKLFETDSDGFEDDSIVLDFLQKLIDTANRSSVVIYAIDARGLQVTGPTAEDNISDASGSSIADIISSRSQQLTDTQDGLKYLSDETGGFAIVNNNDLAGGVRRVLDDQSYYLIGYEPDDETFDAAKLRFNKLTVKVLRQGMTARTRSGFLSVATRERESISPNLTPVQQLETALTSPFKVNDIRLSLNALFASDAKRAPFVRSLLHVDASNLKFTDAPNGMKKAVFDILAVAFGDNGEVVDQLAKNYTLTMPEARYREIMQKGFVYHFVFPVKRPGAFQYRVAVRDTLSGQVGSASQFVEVPDLKKKRLTTSSIVIESVSENEWLRSMGPTEGPPRTDALTDTAVRRINAGGMLRYGYEVYNARLDKLKKPALTSRIRVFYEGKLLLEGAERPIRSTNQTDMDRLKNVGAIDLSKAGPGDYILQVIVTDNAIPGKPKVATQFVQFEVVR